MIFTISNATLALDPGCGPVDVIVTDGRITDVRTHAAQSDGEFVDATGKYLLPGLVDTHLHLTGRQNLVDLARAGVTTGVDLGTHPDELIASLRDVPGMASIISAGSAASAHGSTQTTRMGFPAESVVDGPEDAERFVRWRLANDSDLIKIIIEDPHDPTVSALDAATLRAIVDAAHAHDLLTVAHVVTAHSFEMGLDAEVDVLTHAPADHPLSPYTIERMVEAGTIASPTLVMMQTVIGKRAGQPGPALDFAACIESVRAMHAAGVPIIAGTDANQTPIAPVAHGTSLHDELDLLVEAGLTHREALVAATQDAAKYLRLDDRGRIEPGLRADLVLLDADPIADLSAARTPALVWVAGKPVDMP